MTDIAYLPDEQKQMLVLDLFKEFGITEYRKNGHELVHRCTLGLGGHQDGNSWTASVNYHKLEFNCFVCGNGGGLAWWIAVNRGETSSEQVSQWLQRRTRLGGEDGLSLTSVLQIIDAIMHPESEVTPLPFYDDRLLNRWHQWRGFHPYLTDPRSEGGREIPEDNLARFEVGYADEDTDFDYHQRIIIPVRWKGNIVGWQARALDPNDPEYSIKYKNSPMFPRDRVLYGEATGDHAVVVESPLSVLRHIHQIPMLATFGAKVTNSQVRILSSYPKLTIFMDADKAGYSATGKLLARLRRHATIMVVDNPFRADPADLDDDTFTEIVGKAVPGAIWKPKRYSELQEYK